MTSLIYIYIYCQVMHFNSSNNTTIQHVEKESQVFDEAYQWFYEGSNGWWRYDERTSIDIEKAYKLDDTSKVQLLIAGYIYSIDFASMLQVCLRSWIPVLCCDRHKTKCFSVYNIGIQCNTTLYTFIFVSYNILNTL